MGDSLAKSSNAIRVIRGNVLVGLYDLETLDKMGMRKQYGRKDGQSNKKQKKPNCASAISPSIRRSNSAKPAGTPSAMRTWTSSRGSFSRAVSSASESFLRLVQS